MPSSPTEERLAALTIGYDAALEAVLLDDLERAESLLIGCDEMVRGIPAPEHDDEREKLARTKALDAYGRLVDALRQARDATQKDLQQVWQGQHALSGYGGRSDSVGTRVSSDA